jgi:hypothetical protein
MLHECNSEFVIVIPKYLNFATFSKDLLPVFTLRFCPAFCSQDVNIYLVSSPFTSKQVCEWVTLNVENKSAAPDA